MLYKVVPWIDADDLDFSPCTTYKEAKELGDLFYPEGYDIEEITSA